MSNLPDELWGRIMEAGIQSGVLDYRDLCCLSISSRLLHRLSGEEVLWSALVVLDFASEGRGSSSSATSCSSDKSSSLSAKSLYKMKFERNRARKRAAWRLAMLKEESQIAEHTRKLEDLRSLLDREHEKLKMASAELRNLERARRASVAMNVWQPEVVRSSHRQLVEQCTVPIKSRASSLEMELKLCKQQIAIYSKAFSSHKQKLEERKDALASLKYHPIGSYELDSRSNSCAKRQRTMNGCSGCSE